MRLTPQIQQKVAPFQIEGAQFLTDRRYALLADEMGLGKTLQALIALYQSDSVKALILCPATVKIGWQRSIKTWGLPFSSQVIQSSKDKLQNAEITIINYEQIIKAQRRTQLMDQKYTHLICDESHYLKDFEAQRTETVLGVCGLRQQAQRVWCMTGTPVLNRPVELYPTLKSLCSERLGKYRSWMRYTQRYCQGHYDNWGYNSNGKSNLDELASLLDGFMLRRLADQVDFDIPEKEYTKVIVPANNSIRKLDEQGRKQAKTLNEAAGEISSARMELGVRKVDHAIRHIEYLLTVKKKIVVFGYHRQVMQQLNQRLKKHKPVLVYGGLTSEKKQQHIDHFISDPSCRIFLANILAVGVGVDGLQHATDTAFFVELVSTPGTLHQAADRIRRKGQRNNVLIQALVFEDSYDEEILESFIDKEKTINRITRDQRGVTKLNEKPVNKIIRRKTMSEQITEKLDALIDVIADRIIKRIEQKISPTVAVGEVVVEKDEPAPQEKPVKAAKKAKKQPAPEKIQDEKIKITDVSSLRTKLSGYLANLSSDEDTERKKAMNQRIARRLKDEVGSLVIEQCDTDQLKKYKEVLIEEFKDEFGEEAWLSIVQ